MGHDVTDITVEVFNHCAGSCTGCLLTPRERKAVYPIMPPPVFDRAMASVAAYGEQTGTRYRPVLVFGDVPLLSPAVQSAYYAAVKDRGLALGLTMTLVAPREDDYRRGFEAALAADPDAVFDITVDPVRLLRDPGYGRRLRMAIETAPELHLQSLLSEALLAKHSPEDLAEIMDAELLGRPLSLGFTPAIANIGKSNYGYDVASASDWARRFYRATPAGSRLLDDELARFEASGTFGEFIAQTFHIAADADVFAVAYTMFGDVVLDSRNGGSSLGNLEFSGLKPILHGKVARRLSLLSSVWIDQGGFGCEDCAHRPSCAFQGVGVVRHLYTDHEFRAGACHGPASFARLNVLEPA